uniref:Uncharacterized protein n=1 Tax=Klebsiella pneumoniae TaxID=573 RepID=A0A6G9HSS2_KLEPN|nr:hypothetical protein [Klebsiella pneumoniae]
MINLAVEFAALVNFIASVTLYTVANFRLFEQLFLLFFVFLISVFR